MHELMKKTCDALEDIEHSSNLNIMDNSDRRLVSELVDLKKNILKVQKLEDEMKGYSEDGEWEADMRGTYGRGSSYENRGQNRGRNGGMVRNGYSSRRDSRGRYSRDDGREEMIEHVKMAIETAPDEYKGDIKRFLREIEG